MIILFGMAGSGKGTQGEALSEIFGWRWLSVGHHYAHRQNTGNGQNHGLDDGRR